MDAKETPYRTITEPGYFLALKSRNNSTAVLIGVPNPPYNPNVQEQLELDPNQVEKAIEKGEIHVRRFSCTENGPIEITE